MMDPSESLNMAKPVDSGFLKEHFREQQDRMEISDEDWSEYEKRIQQQHRKRRRGRSDERTDKRSRAKLNELDTSLQHDTAKQIPKVPKNINSPQCDPIQTHGIGAEVADSSRSSQAPAEPLTKLQKPDQKDISSSSSYVPSPVATPLKSKSFDFPDGESDTFIARGLNARRSKVSQNLSRQSTNQKGLAGKDAQQAKREAQKLKAAREEKETRMTPLEYAAILQEKWSTRVANTPSEKLFLTNMVFFLVFEEQNRAHKDTRIKLDIIAKHGGKVVAKYDPSIVTHIVPASTSISLKKTLRALGLSSLAEIPSNVKTVKWDWIVSGLSKRHPDSEVMHELFKQRMAYMFPVRNTSEDAGGKGKEKARSSTIEHSVISVFNSVDGSQNEGDDNDPLAGSRPGTSNHPEHLLTTSKIKDEPEDPLLPFYAKAREDANLEASDDEFSLKQNGIQEKPKVERYKGFQCDKKGIDVQGTSPNWDIIEKLAELRELHRESGTTDDMWRVISYQKAIGSLKSHPKRISSHEEAVKLAGISDKTADKIMEIVKTGELRRINYTKTEELDSIRLFRGIYGVGSNTARKWYNQGFKTLEDLRQAVHNGTQKLSAAQETDINDPMPRAEAQEIFEKIKPIALDLDAQLSMEIMGSFRRGKSTCGDIDILLTRPTTDGVTHAGILPRLCNLLRKHGILTEDLATPEEWDALEATYRGICRRDETSKRRRIDILCIPYESRGAARLYYTGDDIFNRSIRLKANKLNMSLNQRGLFEGVVRDPQDRKKKLCPGTLLCSHSERKIFEILGVPWQEPHERVRAG